MADLLPNPGLGEVDFWQQQQRWSLRLESIYEYEHSQWEIIYCMTCMTRIGNKMVSWFHSSWRENHDFFLGRCSESFGWFVHQGLRGQLFLQRALPSAKAYPAPQKARKSNTPIVQMTACAHMWQRHLRFDWDWCPSMPSAVAKNKHQVLKEVSRDTNHSSTGDTLANLWTQLPQPSLWAVLSIVLILWRQWKTFLPGHAWFKNWSNKTTHQHIDSSRLLISFSNSTTPGCCFGTLSCRRIATRDVRGEPRGEWRGEWRGEPLPTRLRAPEATFDVMWCNHVSKSKARWETAVKKICKFGVETLRNKIRQYDVGRS